MRGAKAKKRLKLGYIDLTKVKNIPKMISNEVSNEGGRRK